MKSLQSIVLGSPPKNPDGPDPRVAAMMKILEKGFPEGVIALCASCGAFEEFGLDEAAVMIVDHTWPRCCSKKMAMEDPELAPRY